MRTSAGVAGGCKSGAQGMTAQADKSDLADRLQFVGLDHNARQNLQDVSDVIRESIGPALDTFYAKVKTTPHTAAFFRNDAHVAGAKKRQMEHWSIVADAKYDESYVDGVTAVGRAHARIGLEPRWYIGGYAVLMDQLVKALVDKRWPSRFGKGKSSRLAEEIGAVVKAALLDMDYSISVYLDILARERAEAEEAKRIAEAEQAAALAELTKVLDALSEGDLEARLPEDLPGNFAKMVVDYNKAMDGLRETIGTVRSAAERILSETTGISESADDLAHRTEQQAAGLEESTAALHELTQNVTTTADGAARASGAVKAALTEAETSGSVVRQAVTAMGEIEKSSDEISKIIGVIDEIAFQTNLLALNAGVEAARAGDAGRGFAVVAQEVRELAQRCAGAAKEIKGLISQSSGQVQSGVGLVNNTGKALESIIRRIGEIDATVSGIAGAASDQSGGLREVNQAIAAMDQITQQNAGMVERTSGQTRALRDEVERLTMALRRFNTRSAERLAEDAARRQPLRRSA
jgi:methyl-accepting chemotaxis protein